MNMMGAFASAIKDAKYESMKVKVTKQDCPRDSLIEPFANSADYCDSFSAPLTQPVPPADIMRCFFVSFPGWMHALMRLRGTFARMLGLKHPGGEKMKREFEEFRGEIGQGISLFRVTERGEQEILTRGDDSHLQFHLSCAQRDGALVLTTTVKFHRALGRWYFAVVKPFHIVMMYGITRRMVTLLGKPASEWPSIVTE